ncbi:MAG: DegT/DnrJ/EryC1/StrS aminotransferase family protein [Thiobacillus sp.]|nr:DegT/DnrJ/EryC1/StrS aminotransferase family protein [Thiobacillus sp.]
MREKFLVFGAPCIEQAEIDEVVATLKSGWIGSGPRVARFEQAFGAYKGTRHAVAVNSCTSALHLALLASGIGPGDEVITTPLTFAATVNAILHAGATPVLADVDPASMNIDPAHIAAGITPRTRAIIPVHYAGRPCDMAAILALARRHGLLVIEDCAHAIETVYQGKPAGTLGDIGCFSFYSTKNITTAEGGMLLLQTPEQASRIKTLALHGMSKDAWKRYGDAGFRHYLVEEIGYKFNMTDLQAAIGLHQLDRIEAGLNRRRAIWQRYDEAFADLPIDLPAAEEADTRHARHLYTIQVDGERCGVGRDAFLDRMTAERIGVGVHYLSLPEHPAYRRLLGWRPEDYPNALRIGRTTVSLPLSACLADRDVEDVVAAVRKILAG